MGSASSGTSLRDIDGKMDIFSVHLITCSLSIIFTSCSTPRMVLVLAKLVKMDMNSLNFASGFAFL